MREPDQIDPVLAANYIAHMRVGDPLADAVEANLWELPRPESTRLIRAAIEQQDNVLCHAPWSLQDFVHEVATVPAWYDRAVGVHGCRA